MPTNFEALKSHITLEGFADIMSHEDSCDACPAKVFCKMHGPAGTGEYNECYVIFLAWGKEDLK